MSVPRPDDAEQPGFDLHDWESRWASIEEELGGNEPAALSLLAELVERMLVANGYALGDPVAESGDEPEVVVAYRSARETAERAELGTASHDEVEVAIDDLRELVSTLAGDVGVG